MKKLTVSIGKMRFRDVAADPNDQKLLIKDVDFSLEKGEVVSFIGASGSGKTTLLRMIAGLQEGYEGRICIDGKEVRNPNGCVQLVFQNSFLLPWLNVENNIKFAIPRSDEGEIAKWLNEFGLVDRRKAYPKTLSGGEQARVALAMALVRKPEVLLLDEPFHSLDAITKINIKNIVKEMIIKYSIAVIISSHDIDDAISLSDRIFVLKTNPLSIGAEFNVSESHEKFGLILNDKITESLRAFHYEAKSLHDVRHRN